MVVTLWWMMRCSYVNIFTRASTFVSYHISISGAGEDGRSCGGGSRGGEESLECEGNFLMAGQKGVFRKNRKVFKKWRIC